MLWRPKTIWHCIFFPRRTLAHIKELQANQRKKFISTSSPGSLDADEAEWWSPRPGFKPEYLSARNNQNRDIPPFDHEDV